MVVKGHSYEVISQIVKRSMTTIGRYMEAYRQKGLSGLAMVWPGSQVVPQLAWWRLALFAPETNVR